MKHVHSKEPLTDVLTLTIIKTGGIKTISLYGGEDIAAFRISENYQGTKVYNLKYPVLSFGPNYYRLSFMDTRRKRFFTLVFGFCFFHFMYSTRF